MATTALEKQVAGEIFEELQRRKVGLKQLHDKLFWGIAIPILAKHGFPQPGEGRSVCGRNAYRLLLARLKRLEAKREAGQASGKARVTNAEKELRQQLEELNQRLKDNEKHAAVVITPGMRLDAYRHEKRLMKGIPESDR